MGLVSRILSRVTDTAGLLQLALVRNRIEKKTDFARIRRPVLLLYGYLASRRVFNIFESRLRFDGYDVFSLNLGGTLQTFNTAGIDALAELVKKKLEGLIERHHIRVPIQIVGHSKGGLVARHYVQMLDGDRHVSTVITLGSPHHGAGIALFGALTPFGLFSRSLWQMRPNSPFLERLNRAPLAAHVKLVSIYSPADGVARYPTAILDARDNIKSIEVAGVGHGGYLVHKRVYDIVRRELSNSDDTARKSSVSR